MPRFYNPVKTNKNITLNDTLEKVTAFFLEYSVVLSAENLELSTKKNPKESIKYY